ncbi:MAG: hypothetical protein ACRDY5_04485, partial [Acidimicrobiales bacterium]
VGLLVAFNLVKAVLIVSDGRELGTPGTAELLPLPDNATVVAQRTLQSEGSLGGGTRVLVVDTSATGRPANAFPGAYLDALAGRGWRRPGELAALSNESGTCVTVDALEDYLGAREEPEEIDRWLRAQGRPAATTAVVTAGHS